MFTFGAGLSGLNASVADGKEKSHFSSQFYLIKKLIPTVADPNSELVSSFLSMISGIVLSISRDQKQRCRFYRGELGIKQRLSE
jgi:hypothetical protein